MLRWESLYLTKGIPFRLADLVLNINIERAKVKLILEVLLLHSCQKVFQELRVCTPLAQCTKADLTPKGRGEVLSLN